jgi:hypothetical protein
MLIVLYLVSTVFSATLYGYYVNYIFIIVKNWLYYILSETSKMGGHKLHSRG